MTLSFWFLPKFCFEVERGSAGESMSTWQRDWYFIASRSCEHFPDGFDLHPLRPPGTGTSGLWFHVGATPHFCCFAYRHWYQKSFTRARCTTRQWPVGKNDCVLLLFCTTKNIFVRISERELTFEVNSSTHLGELTFILSGF